ncbi:LysR substrate-binding domain-containing protein [Arthrobacter nitrophenolicus]|jgi:DNA-binding transcriptional LysR family regulator|uniref:LysR family transcriptional regulator n=2 Tax=Arthrobacter nitrophenolicus TaxID=683150 RepID=L8TIC8_9MICC|nr:LysR family transcriptional regulator [Arthrobacter nitrophenolicus]ELT43088.1 LysR family transcriptional regulator [Arthrobacter nitrophenolicus]TDL37366.1 LysR family transcriptional regulator [Arthrobacter nitrophenolicus]
MLNIRRLELLLDVVELGSITAAADKHVYSPSGVSQQLRRLEAEVGQPLLQRQARGMVPTDAGHVLTAHTRKILRQMAAAEADLAEIAGLNRGSLTMGTFPTLGGSFLPLVISRFKAQYPAIDLHVRSSRFNELIEMLENGQVGMSLLWDYEWNRLNPESFALTTVFEDATALIVGKDHRLARRKQVDMADLAKEEWIVREEEHPVLEVLHRSAQAAGFVPRISFHANDYQEAQAMVSVGLGVALAPRTAVVNKHPGVSIVSLGSSAPARRVLLAHRHDRVRAAAEVAFQTTLLEVAKESAADFR